MFVTSSDQRAGLLVAVVSGGRPARKDRLTARLLSSFDGAGFADVVWVVSDVDADSYDRDGHALAVYPRLWAEEYAAAHWMRPERPTGFLGAFAGREWACLEAERRGCWGVLQLDDNVLRLAVFRGGGAGYDLGRRYGLTLYADLLAAVALSTNGRMVGAALESLPQGQLVTARAGFPYSVFVERVGADREPWFGPFEDDVTHAFQYGTRADGATAALVPALRYKKESRSKSGMRGNYDYTRAVQLQRIFPESAKIGVRRRLSNGKGSPRVFHTMLAGAIRNPLRVHDSVLFGAVKARLEELVMEWHAGQLEANRVKVAKRCSGKASA